VGNEWEFEREEENIDGRGKREGRKKVKIFLLCFCASSAKQIKLSNLQSYNQHLNKQRKQRTALNTNTMRRNYKH